MLTPRVLALSAVASIALTGFAPLISTAACSSYSTRFQKELSGICVCNATQCDEISSDYAALTGDQVGVFHTSKAGNRLSYSTLKSEPTSATTTTDASTTTILLVDTSITYQKIKGFGGAFTDATSINVYKLQPAVQKRLVDAYFGDKGLQYTLGRVPIGSTDFSESIYSYNHVEGDLNMTNFSIDIDKSIATHKIEFIKRALAASSREIPLFASSWAPPAWMTRENRTQNSHVIGEPGEPYWKALALYYSRFFDEYKKEGIDFWAMTTQNEPVLVSLALLSWQQLRFNATTERDFLKKDLGPLMKKNHPQLQIMVMDDQKDNLPNWDAPLMDPESRQYVAGVGVHWYKNLDFLADGLGNFQELSDFHAKYPDVFILATEACAGSMPDGIGTGRGVKMNDTAIIWQRAENYARDIINDLANFAVGWTDWNMALDTQGGPNWATNVVDAPIIVDETGGGEFYKQPMYYIMGHFAKFLVPNATRVALNISATSLTTNALSKVDRVAFLSPTKQLIVVLQNRGNASLALTVRDTQSQRDVRVTLPANAVQTILFAASAGKSDASVTSAPSASSAAASPLMALSSCAAGLIALVMMVVA